jgi:hypothetical protein
MNLKSPGNSHHLLTSRCQYFAINLRGEERWQDSVRGLELPIFKFVLAVLLVGLSPVPALAKGKPPKENGTYDITVSGYYRGGGRAVASPSTVAIDAVVKDDAGASHRLTARALRRDPDGNGRHYLFSGSGTLDGMETVIDGRVDAPDARRTDVLKAGRILFTFKVLTNGRHGRGGGEKRGGGNGNNNPGDSGSNPGNDGGLGNGNPGTGGGNSGNGGGGNPGTGNPGVGSSRNGNSDNGNAGTSIPGNGSARAGGNRNRR